MRARLHRGGPRRTTVDSDWRDKHHLATAPSRARNTVEASLALTRPVPETRDPPLAPDPARGSPCTTRVVALDFADKSEKPIELSAVRSALAKDHFVWIDLAASDRRQAREILGELKLLHEDVIDALLAEESSNPYSRYESYLHLALAVFRDDGELATHLGLERQPMCQPPVRQVCSVGFRASSCSSPALLSSITCLTVSP